MSGLKTRLKRAEAAQRARHPEACAAWRAAYQVYRHYADGAACGFDEDERIWALLAIEDEIVPPGLNLPTDQIRLLASTLHQTLHHTNTLHAYFCLEAGRPLEGDLQERFQARDGKSLEELVYAACDEAFPYLDKVYAAKTTGRDGGVPPIMIWAYDLAEQWLLAWADKAEAEQSE